GYKYLICSDMKEQQLTPVVCSPTTNVIQIIHYYYHISSNTNSIVLLLHQIKTHGKTRKKRRTDNAGFLGFRKSFYTGYYSSAARSQTALQYRSDYGKSPGRKRVSESRHNRQY